jgi:hypothetical protein
MLWSESDVWFMRRKELQMVLSISITYRCRDLNLNQFATTGK